MKKKIFTLLTLLVAVCSGAWAAAETIGLTQTVSGSELAAAAYEGTTNATVAEAHGSGCGINQSGRTVYYNNDDSYTAAKCFRKTTTLSAWDDDTWVGYTVTVASGYKMSLSNLNATLWDASNTTFTWRVVVENSSETALYTSSQTTSSKSETGVITVASPTGVTDLPAGTYTVKIQLYQNGGNKYFAIPYLTFDATVEEDATPSYTVTTSVTPSESGTVTPATGIHVEGTDVTLTATPNTGYKFIKWTVDDVDVEANPYVISSIAANHTAVATFEALNTISFEKGEGTGTVPSVGYADDGEDFTIPEAYFLYKSGATLTGWSDGVNTYAPGATISNVTSDLTLTAQFTDNTVALGDAATTVNWTFARSEGPAINCEGSETDYVQHTIIGSTRFDAVMHINTTKGAAIADTKGKVNNNSYTDKAQVNKGSLFTIPVVNGTIITYTATSGSPVAGNITFGGNNGTVKGKVTSYTYSGETGTLDIVDTEGGFYPSGITAVYPATSESITVSSAGFATYVSANNLDYTSTNIKAYTVNVAEKGVATLTQINKVQAGVPVLLYKEGGATEAIPVCDDYDTPGTNNLKVGTGAAVATSETIDEVKYTNMILNNVSGIGFYFAAGQTVATNRAYLHILTTLAPDAETGARGMKLVFEGEVTGVNAVEAASEATQQDGKYFENGQIVIVKNGKKYNAAGAQVK